MSVISKSSRFVCPVLLIVALKVITSPASVKLLPLVSVILSTSFITSIPLRLSRFVKVGSSSAAVEGSSLKLVIVTVSPEGVTNSISAVT